MDKRQSINVTTPFLIMNDSGGGRGRTLTSEQASIAITQRQLWSQAKVRPSPCPLPPHQNIASDGEGHEVAYILQSHDNNAVNCYCRSSFCIKLRGLTMAGTRRDLINAPRFAVNVTSSFVTCTREGLMAIDFTVVARDRRWTLVKTNCCPQLVQEKFKTLQTLYAHLCVFAA